MAPNGYDEVLANCSECKNIDCTCPKTIGRRANKEKIYPIDLRHLWDKLISASRHFEASQDGERTEEFREQELKSVKQIIEVCVKDIEYLLDKKLI